MKSSSCLTNLVLNAVLPVWRESFPPDKIPTGRVPDGVRPLSSRTLSLSSLKKIIAV